MWISTQVGQQRQRRRAQALNRAVHALPVATRRAMLAAARSEVLITGGYANRHGEICPMLAAHRRGARTDVGQFPHAWDRFTQARRPRRATPREIEILRALLEESLSSPAGVPAPAPQATGPDAAKPAPARTAAPATVATAAPPATGTAAAAPAGPRPS